jgi:chromosome partitioning protein
MHIRTTFQGNTMIIICGGTKGGTGKSTLLAHLAATAAGEDRKVLVVDADVQKSLLTWSQARAETAERTGKRLALVNVVAISGKQVGQQVKAMAADYDVVFIDAGGYDNVSQRSAMVVADVYLTPYRPRPVEMWTVDDVAQVVREVQPVNPRLRGWVVLNCVDPSGKKPEDAAVALTAFADVLPVAPVRVGRRVSIEDAFGEGLGILERPGGDQKAVAEVKNLWDFAWNNAAVQE